MAEKDYADQFLDSISILINKKIEAVKFDETKTATIINADQAEKGIYQVSEDQVTKYQAYSTVTEYKVNDAVLVTIPQGNYDNQKIIIGKAVSESDSPIIYIPPFASLVDISNNIITTNLGEQEMWANGPTYRWPLEIKTFPGDNTKLPMKCIWDSNDSAFAYADSLGNHLNLIGYSRIGLQAQVSTFLSIYNAIVGNYGLALEIVFRDIEAMHTQQSFSKFVTFDSSEYFGNIYNFDSYYTQEIVYDISDYSKFAVDRIKLYMYQRNNFKDKNGEKIPAPEEGLDDFFNIAPNIIFKDFYICLGVPAEGFTTDSLSLICNNNKEYYKDVQKISIEQVAALPDDTWNIVQNSFNIIQNRLKIISLKTDASLSEHEICEVILNSNTPLEIYEAIMQIHKLNLPVKITTPDEKENYISNMGLSRANNDYEYNQLLKLQPAMNTIKEYLGSTVGRDLYNAKEIEAVWLHKDDTNGIIARVEDDVLPFNYSIQWYRYKLGASSPDMFAGAHWVRFYGCRKEPDDKYDYCITDTEINEGIAEDIATGSVIVNFIPNINKEQEQIKAVIVYNEAYDDEGNPTVQKYITACEPIIFTNKNLLRSDATIVDLNTLAIRIDDEEQGKYFLYNKSDQLSEDEANEIRTLTAVFEPDQPDVYKKANLTDYTSITWTFPTEDTMIIPATTSAEDATKASTNVFTNVTSVGYFINKKLNRYATNNTVQLSVIKNGLSWEADVTLLFGTSGTSGSDYTLLLNWRNINPVLDVTYPGWDTLNGEVILQDNTGHYIPIPEESKVEYEWLASEIIASNENSKYDFIPENRDLYYPIFLNNSKTFSDDTNPFKKSDNSTYGGYYYYLDANYEDVCETLSQVLEQKVEYNSENQFIVKESIVKDENFNSSIAYFDLEKESYIRLLDKDKTACQISNGLLKVNGQNIDQFYRKRKNDMEEDFSLVTKDEAFFKDIYNLITSNANVYNQFFNNTDYWPKDDSNEYLIQTQDNILTIKSDYYIHLNDKLITIYVYVDNQLVTVNEKFLKDLSDKTVNRSNINIWINNILNSVFCDKDGVILENIIEDDLKRFLLKLVFNIDNIYEYMLKKINITTIPSNNLNYYYKPLNQKTFQNISNLTINNILNDSYQIYQILNYDNSKEFEFSKPKIEFKVLTLPDNIEEKSYNENYSGSVFDSNNNFNYYNKNRVRAFVNINGYYVLDPFEGWCDGETYYEPVQVKGYESKQAPLRFTSSSIEGSQNNTLISVYPQTGLSAETLMNSLSILKVTLTNFGNYDLVAYFSIPLRSGTECNSYGQITKEAKYINGAKDIRYTSGGTLSYDNIPYQLFIRKFDINKNGMTLEETSANESQEDLIEDDTEGNENNYNWGILIPTESLYNYETHNFVPTISKRILQPSPVYIPNLSNYAVQYKTNDGQILWTQPILSYEDNYPSTTLNKWNGEKIITDEEAGVIVSSGLAAGKKERDNTFSGVMLGDWSKTDTEAYITKQTGVYGFNHGSMAYAFKDDGTGFIGKDGAGRIYFDGNKSQIYSSKWKVKRTLQEGMFLDIDDGYLKMNKRVSPGALEYNNPYSGGLDTTKANNISADHFITLSSKEEKWALSIGTSESPSRREFRIDWNGNGHFSGQIDAYGGLIGGWQITQTDLHSIASAGEDSSYNIVLSSVGGGAITVGGKITLSSAGGGTITVGENKPGGKYVQLTGSNGSIFANQGTIGGWTLSDIALTSKDAKTQLIADYDATFTNAEDKKYSIKTPRIKILENDHTATFGVGTGAKGAGAGSETDIIGIFSGESIVLETSATTNIRLSGPGSGELCDTINLQAKTIYLGKHDISNSAEEGVVVPTIYINKETLENYIKSVTKKLIKEEVEDYLDNNLDNKIRDYLNNDNFNYNGDWLDLTSYISQYIKDEVSRYF